MTTHTKLTKEEVRGPDTILEKLGIIFDWAHARRKQIQIVVISFLILGGGLAAWESFKEKAELKAQLKYYEVYKKIMEKKAAESLKDEDPTKVATKEAANTPPKKVDYELEIQELKNIVEQESKTTAGALAGMTLSELYIKAEKYDQALEALKKVPGKTKSLVGILVAAQVGNAKATKNDCKGALETWQALLNSDSAKWLHSELNLRTGLCYEQLGDLAAAQTAYQKVVDVATDSPAKQSAQKYLRLLAFKKGAQ